MAVMTPPPGHATLKKGQAPCDDLPSRGRAVEEVVLALFTAPIMLDDKKQ